MNSAPLPFKNQVELSRRSKATLTLDGNDELGIDGGERLSKMYLFRPSWSAHSDFSADRGRLLEDKRDKMKEIQENRKNL